MRPRRTANGQCKNQVKTQIDASMKQDSRPMSAYADVNWRTSNDGNKLIIMRKHDAAYDISRKSDSNNVYASYKAKDPS